MRVTRFGGWVESIEVDSPHDGGPAVDVLVSWTTTLLARRGIDITVGPKIGGLLRAAGLAPVYAHAVPLPIGAYGGRVATMLARDFVSVQKSLGGPYVAAGLTTDAEFTQTLATAQADLDSLQYRCVAPWYISVGQRSRVG